MALQDPYCAWDKVQGKCRSHGSGRWGEESYFFQSVATGQHTACPPPKLSKDPGSLGGLSSSLPKFSQDHQPSKDQPDGQVINIVQEKTYESSGKHNFLKKKFKNELKGFLQQILLFLQQIRFQLSILWKP